MCPWCGVKLLLSKEVYVVDNCRGALKQLQSFRYSIIHRLDKEMFRKDVWTLTVIGRNYPVNAHRLVATPDGQLAQKLESQTGSNVLEI